MIIRKTYLLVSLLFIAFPLTTMAMLENPTPGDHIFLHAMNLIAHCKNPKVGIPSEYTTKRQSEAAELFRDSSSIAEQYKIHLLTSATKSEQEQYIDFVLDYRLLTITRVEGHPIKDECDLTSKRYQSIKSLQLKSLQRKTYSDEDNLKFEQLVQCATYSSLYWRNFMEGRPPEKAWK